MSNGDLDCITSRDLCLQSTEDSPALESSAVVRRVQAQVLLMLEEYEASRGQASTGRTGALVLLLAGMKALSRSAMAQLCFGPQEAPAWERMLQDALLPALFPPL